ncbi:MAG: adenylate/guanylate cyclase domain-containing protein [Aeromicrobium sp.]
MSRSEKSDKLARLILGGDISYDSREVIEKGGLSFENGQRLWRALGFPDTGSDKAYSKRDVEAMKTVASALDSGALDEETVFRMTRALGHTMSRLADWQVSTLVDMVESVVETGTADSRLDAAIELAETVTPNFEKLIIYAWRRHLAASVARVEALGASDEESTTNSVTVGFADLVRFTALSNGLDDASLASLVETFEARCTDIVTGRGGRVIKTLCDAVLFVCEDPRLATQIALDIVRQIGTRQDLPDVRVGLATGSVINRLGDVFGPPVNLAARLTGIARTNRVIVDQATADFLGEEFETRTLPARPLRGFGNVEPVTVSLRRTFGR